MNQNFEYNEKIWTRQVWRTWKLFSLWLAWLILAVVRWSQFIWCTSSALLASLNLFLFWSLDFQEWLSAFYEWSLRISLGCKHVKATLTYKSYVLRRKTFLILSTIGCSLSTLTFAAIFWKIKNSEYTVKGINYKSNNFN